VYVILKNSFLHSYFCISPHIVYEIEKKNSILFYGTCIENILIMQKKNLSIKAHKVIYRQLTCMMNNNPKL